MFVYIFQVAKWVVLDGEAIKNAQHLPKDTKI